MYILRGYRLNSISRCASVFHLEPDKMPHSAQDPQFSHTRMNDDESKINNDQDLS